MMKDHKQEGYVDMQLVPVDYIKQWQKNDSELQLLRTIAKEVTWPPEDTPKWKEIFDTLRG